MLRFVPLALLVAACAPTDDDPNGDDTDTTPGELTFTTVLKGSDGIDKPRDLEFHPKRTDELWVICRGTENSGGNVAIVNATGTADQSVDLRVDGNAWHFMSLPSAMAFSEDNNNWATTTEITDANHQGGSFAGPTLWSSNKSIFAMPSGGNGSHLDMLHGSPNSMGIAHEVDNAFWVFDGYNNQIVRYDFHADHGPGNDDHSDGKIHRYTELEVQMVKGIPSHMVLDKSTDWLYIADTHGGRVLRLDTASGERETNLAPTNEILGEHWQMTGEITEVFVNEGLDAPSGIALDGNKLYVGDNGTGEVVVYDVSNGDELYRIDTEAQSLMGLEIHDGALWFADFRADKIIRVDGI